MALLRFLRSAALGSLSVLLYGYVDLVAPQWSFTAFLGLLTVLSFGYGKHMEALALAAAFAAAPYIRLERMYLAVAVAAALAYLGAKEVGRDPQDEEMWDNSPEARVRRILLEHAPHKLPKLPRILEKYGGDWDEMLSAAEAKYVYGTAAPTPFQTPSKTPQKELAPKLNVVADGPMRQPIFESPAASVPEDEAGVEFLYEDEVLRPKAVEEATPEAAPVTRSGRRKSSSKLEEARAKALREQNERKTERIRVLRNKKSPQTSA
uniref:Uncharacterized protein n=1 Tax=Pinguiococcus pyrenoidosus TaxID=172671 RepID=A0A6U0W6B7_9STRA|mmetsp:Transcript_8529/g.32104  ORF Transcript_8529/g.32104 Transcript_8529/m.32104 type:complete len:264 (+) Transcript_8529:40-831(+)